LAISHVAVTSEREVVVVDVQDRPGVLADLTRKIARAGVNLDLVYVATRNRVVFGAADLAALRAALDGAADGCIGSQPPGALIDPASKVLTPAITDTARPRTRARS
jgi:ACT domain